MHVRISLVVSVMGGLLLDVGCSGRDRDQGRSEGSSAPECEAYLAAYEVCLRAAGPEAAAAAPSRLASMRETLVAKGDVTVQRLRASCTKGAAKLGSMCR